MLANSIEAFRSEGVQTKVISTGEVEGDFAAALQRCGVATVHVPFTGSTGFLRRLLRECQGGDVVHIHTERASFWIATLLRLKGLPVVRSIHSSFPFQGRLRRIRSLQRRMMVKMGVTFVAIGEQVAANERTRFGIHPRVIRNWADEKYYRATWSKPSHAGLHILSVGNCGEPKNHEALLKSMALLDNSLNVTYTHVGDEAGAIVDERKLSRELGIASQVTFAGSREPLSALLNADVFVMPSVREGLPLAALEAIATGIPTLLAESPGLREFSSTPGVWWSEPTPEALAAKLEEIATTPLEVRAARGGEAAASVANDFGPTVGRCRYIDLYRRMACREVRG